MNIFYANCKHENWEQCKKHKIFGLHSTLPNLETGDLILLRVTGHSGQPYGVRAIWQFDKAIAVQKDTFVPWKDGEYRWIIKYTPIVEFKKPISEEFATSSKISQKLDGLYATRLMGSIGELKFSEALAYLKLVFEVADKKHLEKEKVPQGISVYDFLLEITNTIEKSIIGTKLAPPPRKLVSELPAEEYFLEEEELRQPNYGVVGERIDLPILNYAPLNEMGVIILFGYYMKDLGFSHLEEIRTAFPDAVGMQKVNDKKFRRVKIEFEYKSKNFLQHGHPLKECDIIVCWEHNWPDCPIEVIELQKALFRE